MRIMLFIFLSVLFSPSVFSSSDISQRERLAASIDLDMFEAKMKAPNVSASVHPKKNIKKSRKRHHFYLNNNNSKLSLWPKAYLSVGGDLYYIHYGEVQNGSTLDKDIGSVMGYYFNFGCSGSKYIQYLPGIPYLEAYFKYSKGKVKYDGGTTGGTSLSFQQNLEIERFGLKIGAKKHVSDEELIYGYFDVGKRVWIRGSNGIIKGALSYKEKYHWLYLGFGAGTKRKIGNRMIAGIEGELMYAPRSFRKMHAELYDGNTFTLGSLWGVELKVPVHYIITKRFSFDITPYYTFWYIDESNTEILKIGGIPVRYVHEPRSKTHTYGILFGFTIALI